MIFLFDKRVAARMGSEAFLELKFLSAL